MVKFLYMFGLFVRPQTQKKRNVARFSAAFVYLLTIFGDLPGANSKADGTSGQFEIKLVTKIPREEEEPVTHAFTWRTRELSSIKVEKISYFLYEQ